MLCVRGHVRLHLRLRLRLRLSLRLRLRLRLVCDFLKCVRTRACVCMCV